MLILLHPITSLFHSGACTHSLGLRTCWWSCAGPELSLSDKNFNEPFHKGSELQESLYLQKGYWNAICFESLSKWRVLEMPVHEDSTQVHPFNRIWHWLRGSLRITPSEWAAKNSLKNSLQVWHYIGMNTQDHYTPLLLELQVSPERVIHSSPLHFTPQESQARAKQKTANDEKWDCSPVLAFSVSLCVALSLSCVYLRLDLNSQSSETQASVKLKAILWPQPLQMLRL